VDDRIRAALAGREAYVVGGAVRDELLGRPLLDVDVACREPADAAAAYQRAAGGALFPLSERHGAWRVAFREGRTIDFTPLADGIEADLATRDFTINAIAVPLVGGEAVDPFGGQADLERRTIRAVSESIFEDDPLRLLRAVRLEDELGFRLDDATEQLVRAHADLVARPAGERILAELLRLEPAGFRRLDELGLLSRLGGRIPEREPPIDSPEFRLVWFLRDAVARLPLSNELRRLARVALHARCPCDDAPRQIHRFRRATEPWALEALAIQGCDPALAAAVERARRDAPGEPLLRGDELGLPQGPEVGRLLRRIEEERAAGTISTREEALELVRREARAGS
jgi:hypothetical protein